MNRRTIPSNISYQVLRNYISFREYKLDVSTSTLHYYKFPFEVHFYAQEIFFF